MQETKLSRICDRILFYTYCATLYFLPISSAITESLFGIVFVAFVVKRCERFLLLEKEALQDNEKKRISKVGLFITAFKPAPNPLNQPILFYVAFVLISILFSHYPMMSLNAFFFKLFQDIFTFFIFIECFHTVRQLKILLSVLTVSFTLIVTNGLFQFFGGHDFIHHQPITDGRVTSCFKHANDLSSYFITFLPLFLCLSFFYPQKNIDLDKKWFDSIYVKGFLTLLFVIALITLGLTYSRSGWLAFLLSLAWLMYRQPKLLLGMAVCALLFLVIFIPKLKQTRELAFSPEIGSFTSQRTVYWKEAGQIIKENPVFGHGLNTYSMAGTRFRGTGMWGGYPHNCYLQIAAETGIPSLLLFIWILVSLFKMGVKDIRSHPNSLISKILAGLLAGFTGYLIQSFFDTNFYSLRLSSLMWIVIGMIVFAHNLIQKTTTSKSP
jgi:O-antigen ligase